MTEPEAFLYRDDLTIAIGRVPALIDALQRLMSAASGVCKLTVEFPGVTKSGTAFRIADNWLLTNWHVLHSTATGRAAAAVSAEFGYDDDGMGGLVAAVPVRCDPTRIITDKTDDWAVIPSRDPLRAEWATLPLSAAVVPVIDGTAYIVQHPAGGRKRVGFVRNQICDFDDRVIHYLTDTREGSSGAPVFDDQGAADCHPPCRRYSAGSVWQATREEERGHPNSTCAGGAGGPDRTHVGPSSWRARRRMCAF